MSKHGTMCGKKKSCRKDGCRKKMARKEGGKRRVEEEEIPRKSPARHDDDGVNNSILENLCDHGIQRLVIHFFSFRFI